MRVERWQRRAAIIHCQYVIVLLCRDKLVLVQLIDRAEGCHVINIQIVDSYTVQILDESSILRQPSALSLDPVVSVPILWIRLNHA